MIDDVVARLAPEIVDAAEIEQHRVPVVFQGFEPRAKLRRFDALDNCVVDVRSETRWIERGAGNRRRLRAGHRLSS